MGKRDSSKTRVAPVFNLLVTRHASGADWIPQLLRLPMGVSGIAVNPDWDFTIEDRGWGNEALHLLIDNPKKEDWHIFEGTTQPDVFIQTPHVIIVVEGKRTESETTKHIKWMPGRHQMWRHIDCAWEIKGKKEVFGFLIVEGDGAIEDVPAFWMEETIRTMSIEALTSSLPHREPQEQERIHRCFLGVTTWQKVCKEFRIDWKLLPDLAE